MKSLSYFGHIPQQFTAQSDTWNPHDVQAARIQSMLDDPRLRTEQLDIAAKTN